MMALTYFYFKGQLMFTPMFTLISVNMSHPCSNTMHTHINTSKLYRCLHWGPQRLTSILKQICKIKGVPEVLKIPNILAKLVQPKPFPKYYFFLLLTES